MIISLVCGERSLQHKVAGLQHEATDCTSNPRQGNLRYKRVEKILLLEHILGDFQADCIPAGFINPIQIQKKLDLCTSECRIKLLGYNRRQNRRKCRSNQRNSRRICIWKYEKSLLRYNHPEISESNHPETSGMKPGNR